MDIYYKRSEFPVQKLPFRKKTKEWREASVDVLISREGNSLGNGRSRQELMRVNYDLLNGIFNEDDFRHVVNPFDVKEGFPAQPQNMNIIKPKIDLLIGEASKRPFNFKVFGTSDNLISEMQDYKINLLVDEYLRLFYEGAEEEEIDRATAGIDKYIKEGYTSIPEDIAYRSLLYLREHLSLNHEFLKGWKDGLVAGEEIYYTGIVNGEPVCERVNPCHFTYDNDPDLEYVEEGDWAVRRFNMSPGAIYDRFQDHITEDQLDDLLKMTGADSLSRRPSDVNYNSIMYRDKIMSDVNHDEFYKGQLIPVWHTVWKSYKKIGVLKVYDGELEDFTEEIVDEFYKLSDNEKLTGFTISWEWITEVWEGYRVGTNIYFNIAPVAYQYTTIDNPKMSKLPYVGAKYNNTNTRNRSLVDTMKPIQYMYIVVWYRMELAMARDKGKIINMDITQIPKSMGVDINKWLHYLSAIGVNLINPYEEGDNIPGREGGRPASYNQMSAQDLTMSNVIADYIGLLNKLEEMLGELSGVSKQRQGSIGSNELVGNVQRSVVQSALITEPLFEMHHNIIKRANLALLNCAKFAWMQNDKKKIHFILDDFSRSFLDITDDFLYSDFGIFCNDSTKEQQNLEALKGLIQPALQNGATLSDAATILMSESINEITAKLKKIEADRAEQSAQAEQMNQQLQAQQQQMQMQMHDEQLMLQQEELRIKEEDSIRKSNTAIEIAMMRDQGDNESIEPEDNSLEISKLRLQQEKQTLETTHKRNALDEVIRANKKAEEFKQQEIEIKRKVANKPSPSKK